MKTNKCLNEIVTEIVDSESKKSLSEEAKKVLSLTADAVKLTKIDSKVLESMVSELFKDYNDSADSGAVRHFFNAFLGIFGQKLVSRRNDNLNNAYVVPDGKAKTNIIGIDAEAFKIVIHSISNVVDSLADANRRNEARIRDMETHLNNSVRDAENAKNSLVAEQSENLKRETEAIKYIQRLIAERGKDNPPTEDEALGQFLETMDIRFIWDPAEEPNSFQTYSISDTAKVGVSLPCLIKGGSIAAKGLLYTLNSNS